MKDKSTSIISNKNKDDQSEDMNMEDSCHIHENPREFLTKSFINGKNRYGRKKSIGNRIKRLTASEYQRKLHNDEPKLI